MVGLYKRGRVWWAVYRVDGKLIRESLKTRSHPAAQKKAGKLRAQLELGQLHPTGDTPLKDAIESGSLRQLQQNRNAQHHEGRE